MQIDGEQVLVTGAGGFIGSHLVEKLVGKGARVRAFVHYNSLGSWGWLDDLPVQVKKSLEVLSGDVRDAAGVVDAAKGCAAVIHLAALIGIPFSYKSPDSYVDTNVKGTLNVLQAARQSGVKRLLVTSTSEVYGTAQYVPIDEKHPFQAQSPYSASKIGADRMAESFYRCFALPVTIVRPFNTYGPRQSARAVIPTIITQLANASSAINLGNTKPTRDFVFVEDTVDAFLAILGEDKCVGEEINIATGQEVSIGGLFSTLARIIRPDAERREDAQRTRPVNSEVERLLGDNSKIRRLTMWKPNYPLERGLALTIDWFRSGANLSRYRSEYYNV